MGTWGTGLFQNDLAAEVYSKFFEAYDQKTEPLTIKAELLGEYPEALTELEGNTSFWLALAAAQWECGLEDADVLSVVRRIVPEGIDLENWDFDEADCRKRSQVLTRFLAKLDTPTRKPVKPRKRRPIRAPFAPGSCLSVALSDGDFGAALVVENDESSLVAKSLVATLHYKASAPPPLVVFQNPEWLILNHHGWENEVDLVWCLASYYKNAESLLTKVGEVPVDHITFLSDRGLTGWMLNIQVEAQFKWESEKAVEPRKCL